MGEGPRYVLWGSGGHAKVLANLIAIHGGKVVALFDNNPDAASVLAGVPLHIGKTGFISWAEKETGNGDIFGLAAIGGHQGADRLDAQRLFYKHGVKTESIVHPHASVCLTAFLDSGTQVLAQAVVASEARLGEGCIVNHRAGVDHECVIGNGVHLAPGATLCGCVTVEDNVLIGAGSVVMPRITIGRNSIVGAGSVVVHDVPSGGVVAGNPARVINEL